MDIDHNTKWIHLRIVTAYFMSYWHTLRYRDDGLEYDRNMSVISSM